MSVAVWILEDDPNLGFLLETVFSLATPAITSRLFVTGEAALRALGVPDIVFADTNLAGILTGPEVVDVLRKRHPNIFVLFSSSLGVPKDVVLGPRDRVLPKPFSVAALLREIAIIIPQIPPRHVPLAPPPPSPRQHKHR